MGEKQKKPFQLSFKRLVEDPLAAVGREPSDASVAWKHGTAHCGAVSANGVAQVAAAKKIGEKGGRGRTGV